MRLINNIIIAFLKITPKPILFLFAKRYISGSNIQDAVKVVKQLNSKGIKATIDLLGESSTDEKEVMKVLETYKKVADTIVSEKLDAGISVKPTHFGLLIDKEFCFKNIRELLRHTKDKGVFVCIDMEDSPTVDDTLEIYSRLRDQGFDNVGWVSQAMLRRAVDDMKAMSKYKPKVRICKGIYKEPPEVAFTSNYAVHRNFGLLGRVLAEAGGHPCFATHNEDMIWESLNVIQSLNLSKDQYEFQMLYGVKERLRDILVSQGHPVRIYVPFGEDWKPYTLRRFKENPDMLGYAIRAVFTGRRG